MSRKAPEKGSIPLFFLPAGWHRDVMAGACATILDYQAAKSLMIEQLLYQTVSPGFLLCDRETNFYLLWVTLLLTDPFVKIEPTETHYSIFHFYHFCLCII